MVEDFNCDMTLGLDSSESHFRKCFKSILCSYSLKNIINSPTHITFDSRSLIDVIAKSQPAKIQTSGSIDLEIYDHHLIFAVFKVARNNPKPLVISTKKYKEVDKKHLNTDFEHATCLFDDIGDCHFVWNYRKDSCISRTFLLKFWAKNRGCGLYTRPLLSDRVNWLIVVTNWTENLR